MYDATCGSVEITGPNQTEYLIKNGNSICGCTIINDKFADGRVIRYGDEKLSLMEGRVNFNELGTGRLASIDDFIDTSNLEFYVVRFL